MKKSNIKKNLIQEKTFWLKLLDESNLIEIDYSVYINEITEIINILTRISKTTSERLNEK